jgi:hypothetical protein
MNPTNRENKTVTINVPLMAKNMKENMNMKEKQ